MAAFNENVGAHCLFQRYYDTVLEKDGVAVARTKCVNLTY